MPSGPLRQPILFLVTLVWCGLYRTQLQDPAARVAALTADRASHLGGAFLSFFCDFPTVLMLRWIANFVALVSSGKLMVGLVFKAFL